MPVRLLICLSLLFVFRVVVAQEETRLVFGDSTQYKNGLCALTGRVTHAITEEPVAGVHIYTDGAIGGTSDNNGRYYVSLTPGEHKIAFRHITMKPQIYQISIYSLGTIHVAMSEKVFELEGIVVSANQLDQNVSALLAGSIKLPAVVLKSIPALAGEPDVIKSLQLMPGITSVGEGSAGVNVRGGKTDQNLMQLNEALLINTNHAMGFLSPYNSDVVDEIELFKGGVPAYYGGRSAAALNVTTRKGNFLNWKFQASAGTAVSKALVEGPIIKDKLSVLAAGRLSNTNWMLRKAENEDVKSSKVNFYDGFVSISAKLNSKNSFDLNWLSTGDAFRFSDEFGYAWSTQLGSATVKNLINDKFSIVTLAAVGQAKSEFYSIANTNPTQSNIGLNYSQLKTSALYSAKKHNITLGAETLLYNSMPEQLGPYRQSQVTQSSIPKDKGRELGLFLHDEWSPYEWLNISGGWRYSMYWQLGPAHVYAYKPGEPRLQANMIDTIQYSSGKIISYHGWEPRLAAKINVGKTRSIKLAYARLYQYLHTLSNTTSPTPIDLWQVSTVHIQPQRAQNFSLGYFQNLKENIWSVSVEGFYRIAENQLEYKDFADLTLNPHIETEVLSGKGRSYGLEAQIKKNSGKWTGWMNYTYARSFSKVDGNFAEERLNRGAWFPSNHDRPHAWSWVMNRKLYPRSIFGFTFTYLTGRPLSIIDSYYGVNTTVIPNYTLRNKYRIPNYFRVDLSLELGNVFPNIQDNLTIGFYNLFRRRNAYSVYFKRFADRTKLVPYQLSLLGTVLPAITYTVHFKSEKK